MSNSLADRSRIDRILESKTIGADDILVLRREIFGDGVVSRDEVRAVFQLDHECSEKVEEWTHFYVESLTDHFVWQATPSGYVTEKGAEFLMEHILRDGRIDGVTELELLINIIQVAASCPESLVMLILEAVKESVLNPEAALYGRGREPGVVTAVDVQLIRRAIYGKSSDGGYTTSRNEADLLFDLNRKTNTAKNHESWRDLFVKAIGSYLMFPLQPPVTLSADEVMRREARHKAKVGGVVEFFAAMPLPGPRALRESWRELDLTGSRRKAEAEAEAKKIASLAWSKESIDPNEARWLVERIDEDHVIDENERALLVFIQRESPNIDPLLHPLLARLDAE
jgi:hypothetical protein